MNKHLEDNSPDILSLAEAFLRSDDKPKLLHTGYNWFGKCRKSVKDKGGIGICVKTDFPILDENLNSSDDFERCWILGRLNGVKTAIGTVYFPNDGVNKDLTDSLFYELLENCSLFASLGCEIYL